MTVNGVAITPVVYATSHAATFAAVIAAIDALDGVSAVAGTGREILITVDNALSNITVSSATTGGAGQPDRRQQGPHPGVHQPQGYHQPGLPRPVPAGRAE